MRKTIYLSDELAAQVDEYLDIHRNETFSSLVQRVLRREVVKDPSAILKLIGMVSVEPDEIDKEFADRPEDRYHDWYDGPPRAR
jgi:hypothetical protein